VPRLRTYSSARSRFSGTDKPTRAATRYPCGLTYENSARLRRRRWPALRARAIVRVTPDQWISGGRPSRLVIARKTRPRARVGSKAAAPNLPSVQDLRQKAQQPPNVASEDCSLPLPGQLQQLDRINLHTRVDSGAFEPKMILIRRQRPRRHLRGICGLRTPEVSR